MIVRDVFTNPYLGTYYTIENNDAITMVVVKGGKVRFVPGWNYTTLDGEFDAKKFERKALKALRDYLSN